jgi:hypothetical protein
MTCWTAFVYGPSRWRASSATVRAACRAMGRAAGGRLRAGPSGLWAGPDRRRARPTQGAGWSCRPMGSGGCCAATADPPAPSATARGWRRRPTRAAAAGAPPARQLQVDHPGELVQLDCFCIGRLSGTKGTVWQHTAIAVAADQAARGWTLERVMSDNASEFRSVSFQATIATPGPGIASSGPAGPRRTAVWNGSAPGTASSIRAVSTCTCCATSPGLPPRRSRSNCCPRTPLVGSPPTRPGAVPPSVGRRWEGGQLSTLPFSTLKPVGAQVND